MDAAAMEVARLVLRQDPGSESDTVPTCSGANDYDGRMGVRISSIFVILVGSTWGKSLSFAVHHVLYLLWLDVYVTPAVCLVLSLDKIQHLTISHPIYHLLTS